MSLRFGECALDTRSRELLRSGTAVPLTGKAFRLLELLIENRPAALSKDQLQDLLWPGVFVSEVNLTSLINKLRNAIGDDAHAPRFIRTVYGFGYAFCGDLEDAPDAAAPSSKRPTGGFGLIWGRKEIVLAEGENILGRGADAIDPINHRTVSRRHARIVVTGGTATIEDLDSKNGTYVQGRRLARPTGLSDGDAIKIGSVPLAFRRLSDAVSTATGVRVKPRR